MAIKCLNCGSPCLETESSCLSCHGPVHRTDHRLKREAGLGGKGTKFATVFMIIGLCVWNAALAPQLMPSSSHGSGERILAAGGVGMLCAVFGMLLGSFLHGSD